MGVPVVSVDTGVSGWLSEAYERGDEGQWGTVRALEAVQELPTVSLLQVAGGLPWFGNPESPIYKARSHRGPEQRARNNNRSRGQDSSLRGSSQQRPGPIGYTYSSDTWSVGTQTTRAACRLPLEPFSYQCLLPRKHRLNRQEGGPIMFPTRQSTTSYSIWPSPSLVSISCVTWDGVRVVRG